MLHFRIESRDEGLNLVVARFEIGYVVPTVRIRFNDPATSKLRLSDSQDRIRHDRAGNIVHYSSHGSLRSLRQETVLDQKEQGKSSQVGERVQR